ncbi:Lrp/AsnC family transcriptional regulator, partial [Streptomyces sp. NPDC058667]
GGGRGGHPAGGPPSPPPPPAHAVVQVFASDMRHFERVLERIAGEPFVERTKSVLVLSPLLRRFSSGSPA